MKWLLLLFGFVSTANADPFLSSELLEAFQNAPVITAQLVDPMPFTPMFRPEAGQYTTEIALSRSERERLLVALRAAETIDPVTRLKECRYLPGMTFSAKKGDLSYAAILCLNCDVWALDSVGPNGTSLLDSTIMEPVTRSPARLERFADSRPQREAMLALFNELRAKIITKFEQTSPGPRSVNKFAP